jgi:hypothetical protein
MGLPPAKQHPIHCKPFCARSLRQFYQTNPFPNGFPAHSKPSPRPSPVGRERERYIGSCDPRASLRFAIISRPFRTAESIGFKVIRFLPNEANRLSRSFNARRTEVRAPMKNYETNPWSEYRAVKPNRIHRKSFRAKRLRHFYQTNPSLGAQFKVRNSKFCENRIQPETRNPGPETVSEN